MPLSLAGHNDIWWKGYNCETVLWVICLSFKTRTFLLWKPWHPGTKRWERHEQEQASRREHVGTPSDNTSTFQIHPNNSFGILTIVKNMVIHNGDCPCSHLQILSFGLQALTAKKRFVDLTRRGGGGPNVGGCACLNVSEILGTISVSPKKKPHFRQ